MLIKEQMVDLNKLNENNPWKSLRTDMQFLEKDIKFLEKNNGTKILSKIRWEEKEDSHPKLANQFPLPINGNFIKAKYIILYSNPISEKIDINDMDPGTKEKLLNCFNLDKNAEFVIPKNNEAWKTWYTQEFNKFYTIDYNEKQSNNKFIENYCFINFFAYATKNDGFDFTERQIEQISKLPSTKFIIRLVKLAAKFKKTIIIMRTRDKLWRNNVFCNFNLDLE